LALTGVARAISKDTLDFAVVTGNKALFHLQVSNNKKGIEAFVKHLKLTHCDANFSNSLYCMEHTARAAPRHLYKSFTKLSTGKKSPDLVGTSYQNQRQLRYDSW